MVKIKRSKLLHLFHLTNKGLTLIELIIGIIISIIIILTVAYALVYSNKTYQNQIIDYNLTREGSFALSLIERKIRDKSPNKVEIQNNGSKIILEEDGTKTYIAKNGRNLIYFDGTNENVLIKDMIENINFEKEKNDLIKIYIILKQDNFSQSMETKVKLRNK